MIRILSFWFSVLLCTSPALANDYYNHSGIPATGSTGSSAQMRAEFAAIASGVSKLPNLTGNANKAVVVDGGGSALTVTTGGLALGGNFTISGAFATTLTVTGATTVTLPLTGTLATRAGVESLTNKTLVSPTITTPAISTPTLSGGGVLGGTYTGTYTLAGTPTITSPAITGAPTVPIGVSYYAPAANVQMNGAINGLTYGISGSDVVNDLFVNPGGAQDTTNRYWMQRDTALTKRSQTAWAVGDNQGGLDTGVVGNNDYFVWLIARSDTGVVDVLFSLANSAPTMPANYDRKRMIGWFRRTAGATVSFLAEETAGGGIDHLWSTPILSVDLANTLTTTQRNDLIDVPNSVTVDAHIIAMGNDAASFFIAIIQGSTPTNAAPSSSVSPGFNFGTVNIGVFATAELNVRVQGKTLYSRANIATVDTYRVVTKGFTWSRR